MITRKSDRPINIRIVSEQQTQTPKASQGSGRAISIASLSWEEIRDLVDDDAEREWSKRGYTKGLYPAQVCATCGGTVFSCGVCIGCANDFTEV